MNERLLLDAVAVNTVGEMKSVYGGDLNLSVWVPPGGGSFGGGTVTFEVSPDGGVTWIVPLKQDGNPASFTANEVTAIPVLKTGLSMRARLDGSGGASGVSAMVFG